VAVEYGKSCTSVFEPCNFEVDVIVCCNINKGPRARDP